MLVPTLFWVSLLHSLVARATIRQMLGTSLASNGMLKPDVSTQAGEGVFVATYGAGVSDSELADNKTRDLEAGGDEEVVPVEVCPSIPLSSSLIPVLPTKWISDL